MRWGPAEMDSPKSVKGLLGHGRTWRDMAGHWGDSGRARTEFLRQDMVPGGI